eukprot:7150774-Pyramimonas_sp.AAC.1
MGEDNLVGEAPCKVECTRISNAFSNQLQPKVCSPIVGLHTAVKPFLNHSTTGEFNSPPNYSRTVSSTSSGGACRAPHGR